MSLKATLVFIHVDLTEFRPGDSGSESRRLLLNNKQVIIFKTFISFLTRPDFSDFPTNKECADLTKYIGVHQYISWNNEAVLIKSGGRCQALKHIHWIIRSENTNFEIFKINSWWLSQSFLYKLKMLTS